VKTVFLGLTRERISATIKVIELLVLNIGIFKKERYIKPG